MTTLHKQLADVRWEINFLLEEYVKREVSLNQSYYYLKEKERQIMRAVELFEKVESYEHRTSAACEQIALEVTRAKTMYPAMFVNQHEAYAVILEEVDELWDEIKKNQKKYDLPAQKKEATQAAAMLVRFIVELT